MVSSDSHSDGGRGDGPPKESEKESRGNEENPESPKPGAESISRTEGQLCPELIDAKEEERREGPPDLATRRSPATLTSRFRGEGRHEPHWHGLR